MRNHPRDVVLALMLLLGASGITQAACDQTLSPGANVASAVSNAPSGSTICLNSGNYGTVTLSGITKSSYVTVQSVSDKGATISPQISNSRFLQLSNLTISGSTIKACASNIRIASSTFTSGLLVTMRDASCSNYPLNIDIDGNTFGSMSGAMYEGRISVADKDGKQASMGVVIRNNQIRDGCLSDGVFLAGGASGVQIGPGNVFSNIVQSGSVHCDNIQFYGSGWNNSIVGNYFKSGSTYFMLIDGNDNGTIRDNVFEGGTGTSGSPIQMACPSATYPFVFEHNTMRGANVSINYYCRATVRNNVFANSNYTQAGTVSCTNCTTSYNLSNNQTVGTNSIQGSPTFVGGSSPTTWAGYQLTSGSLGYRNGSDGQDRGVTYYGPAVGTTLAAPSNLRIQ